MLAAKSGPMFGNYVLARSGHGDCARLSAFSLYGNSNSGRFPLKFLPEVIIPIAIRPKPASVSNPLPHYKYDVFCNEV